MSVLGNQEQTFNCCLFSQNKSSLKSSDNPSVPLGDPLSVGDTIDIQVDFVNHKVNFWKNLVHLGEISGFYTEKSYLLPIASKFKFVEEHIAPVVSLSV